MDTIVFIDAKKYWSLTHLVCNEMQEDLWWFSSSDELDAMFFGLREFTDSKTVSENPHLKSFKVINPKKYIWAKLKYNI